MSFSKLLLTVAACLFATALATAKGSTATTAPKKLYSVPSMALFPNTSQVAAFRAQIKGRTFCRGEDGFDKASFTYNLRTGVPKPLVIIRAADESDLRTGLAFARRHQLRINVKSTGHEFDVRNIADHSVLFDMSYGFNATTVDVAGRTATLGTGQKFARFLAAVIEASNGTLTAVSGADPTVGPGGWNLGGGHGRLTRLHGLGVDNILSLDVMLANGTVRRKVSAGGQYGELFRAMRGGGGHTFGIVLSLTVPLYADPGAYYSFSAIFPPTAATADGFQDWLGAAPDYCGGYYLMHMTGNYTPYVEIAAYCLGSGHGQKLAPLKAIPDCVSGIPGHPCEIEQVANSYHQYINYTKSDGDIGGVASLYLVSTVLDFNTSRTNKTHQLAAITTEWFAKYNVYHWRGAQIGCSGNGVLGGVARDLDADAEATSVSPALRKGTMAITCYVAWAPTNPSLQSIVDRAFVAESAELFSATILRRASVDDYAYFNEPMHNFQRGPVGWQDRYWGGQARYKRLLAVKRSVDPEDVLTCFQCVGWERIQNRDPAFCLSPANCTCSNSPTGDGLCW